MMTEYHMQAAHVDDLPTIQEIARRTIDKCYRPFLGDEGVDWFIESGESDRELEKHFDNCDVLIANGSIAGFAIYFDDLVHLMMIDVALHRGGLGSRLLAHSERQLFARGNTTIRVETFDGNDQAINFYLKHGWSVTRKEQDQEHGFIRVFFEKTRAVEPP